MTQGSIETTNYYTIKIGEAFLKEFKAGGIYGFRDEQPYIRNVSLSGNESDAYKWYFDSLAEVGDEKDFQHEKNFVETLKLLQDNGMTCKVCKTTIVTTTEQTEVLFVEGKEKKLDGLATGGLVGGSGKLAVLHKDFVLNKGDAEKLFQSIEKFGQNISEVMNSYVEFAKQENKGDELSNTIRKICEQTINDTDTKKASEFADRITKALKNNKGMR